MKKTIALCLCVLVLVNLAFSENLAGLSNTPPYQNRTYSKCLRINGGNDLTLTNPEQISIDFKKRSILAGVLYLPTFVMGFGLTAQGKPHNILLVTGHKLTAAADLALLNYTVYQKNKIKPLGGAEITATVLTNLFYAATIATGAMETFEKPMPDIVHKIHKSGPWLSMLSSAALMFLLESNQ